jgi:hypothetical protein
MKVVQTEISETEHAVLAEYAKLHKTTIKEVVREAVRKLALNDIVDPGSSVFKMFPLTRKKARHEDASERHDAYLYGRDR